MKIQYFGIFPSNVQLANRKLENRSIKDLEILRLLFENLNCNASYIFLGQKAKSNTYVIENYKTVSFHSNSKQAFTNHVEKFLPFFDHLPPSIDIFYFINVDKKSILPPLFVSKRSFLPKPNFLFFLTKTELKRVSNWVS
jgi:hypothetical protein